MAMTPLLTGLLSLLPEVLDKVLPDKAKADEAKIRLLELAQKGELAVLDADLKLAIGQMEINKEEAKTDAFRGGWRPAAGWVCVFGLGYQFILSPILPWLFNAFGAHLPPMPPIDNDTLMTLLGGLLGLGGLRTFERIKGRV
jgi:hypothetical protein